MTIRYKCDTSCGRCYVDEHMPDWSIIEDCFPGRIRLTDIDGAVEINGHVLFMEWKGRDAKLTQGQQIMFQMMTKYAPRQRVLVIFGDKGKPVRALEFLHGNCRILADCDIDFLRFYCSGWAEYAKARPAA